jgi:hypothetical protein
MGFSLSILSIGSLFSGYLLKDAFVGIGTIFWGNTIYKLEHSDIGLDFEFIPLFIKNIPLFFSIFGILLAILLNSILDSYKQIVFNKNVSYKNIIVSYPQSFFLIF